MNAVRHHLPTSQLATSCCDHRFTTQRKWWSSCGCFLNCQNIDLIHGKRFITKNYNAMKVCDKSMDHVDIFSSPVIIRRKHVTPTVTNQSCSELETSPNDSKEQIDENAEEIDPGILDPKLSSSGELHSSNYQSELLFLALPAILGQAIDPVAQLAETAYIGRLGAIELASAGISVTIFNITSKLFNIPLLSITTSFVAEDISKNSCQNLLSEDSVETNIEGRVSDKRLRRQLPSISAALLLAVGIGAFECLALFIGAGQFLKFLGVASASPMYSPAQQFLSLRALGAPAVVLSLAIQGIFRGFKDTQTPLLCVGFGNLSAVCLLPILVYVLQLGLVGAAAATVASQYITVSLLIWALSRKFVLLPPKIGDLQFGGYIKSGGLLLGRTLSVLITMTLGTSMAARQGTLAMAAHQICLQVWLAVSLISDALALSAQALIATSFAKLEYRRVRNITSFVLKTGVFIGAALAIILGVSFGPLSKFFTKDVEVLQIVKTGILFVSASQPINALAFIFDGLHYGVSDFQYAACSMMAVGSISSAFLLYAPSKFGLHGVWYGLTLFMALRMAAGFIRLHWKNGPWQFLWKDYQIAEVNDRPFVEPDASSM